MSKLSKQLDDIEKVVRLLRDKGWRVLGYQITHELDEKPRIEMRAEYDPSDLTTII